MDIFYLKKILKFIRICTILFFVFIFSFLFYKDFVPSGKLIIVNDFQNKPKIISDLDPKIRIRKIKQDNEGNFYQTVFIDPVYFKINPPREFASATLEITYKNKDQPLFQAGIKKGEQDWVFDLKTLEFQKIDQLSWDKIRSGNLILLQKARQYNSLEDFLLNPPKQGRIAEYNYVLEKPDRSQYLIAPLNIKTDLNHVNYIIARYDSPEVKNDFKTAKVKFDINRTYLDQGKLVFMLSAPEMDIYRREIDIYKIKVTLEREPLKLENISGQMIDYLRSIIKNFYVYGATKN